MPLVLVDRYLPDLDCDYVVADNEGGGYRATEHLIILGHTRIGFVYSHKGNLQTTSVRDRFQGYRRALQEYGCPIDETLVYQQSPPPHADGEAFGDLLARPDRPSAIFAVNDGIALELLRAAQRRGLRLPEDLALVGFDDLTFAAHLSPPLTTVAQPRMDLGLRAGNLLINRIEGQTGPPRHIELPTSLIVRESCGRGCGCGRRCSDRKSVVSGPWPVATGHGPLTTDEEQLSPLPRNALAISPANRSGWSGQTGRSGQRGRAGHAGCWPSC